jgi:hypothetical protein
LTTIRSTNAKRLETKAAEKRNEVASFPFLPFPNFLKKRSIPIGARRSPTIAKQW